MLVIENCNSLSELRQKLIDGEEVRTVRQEPCKVSEYDKDHIWYKGNQYISLRRFLEVKAEAEKEPCEDAIRREDALQALCKAVHKNDDTIPCSNQIVSCLWSKTKVQDYAREIYKLPSINSQPKTGHWIRELIRNEKGGCIGAKMICSKCGNDNKHDEYMNYCPNCGTKMQEVEK